MGKTWTGEELAILKLNYGKQAISTWAYKLPNKSQYAIRRKAFDLGMKSALRNKDAVPVFEDLRLPPSDAQIEEIWKALISYQGKSKGLSTQQETANISIDTDKPVMVCFLADLHIGAVSGKYKELKERIDLIASTPNAFVISAGDTVDNYLPSFHSQGQFDVICPPEIQKRLVEYIFSQLESKLLALVQGCHDEGSHEADDFDWTKYLTDKFGCVNLGFGGFVNLKVGKQLYKIAVRHKYRFNSSTNLTSTVKRMREQLGDFDIGCIAHNHQAAIETAVLGDKIERVFVRPGSFKGADRYARSIGFTDTGAQIPTVILFPNKRQMLPFLNIGDAVDVMRAFR
uniref:Calcineurin-like phosphoesterase n=1 Tax=viral metagenome TaxID=1070528 RepID=A0A6M3J9S4_9ZZZZ